MTMEWRWHDDTRRRVWTQELARYGKFEILDDEEFQKLKAVCDKHPNLMTLSQAID